MQNVTNRFLQIKTEKLKNNPPFISKNLYFLEPPNYQEFFSFTILLPSIIFLRVCELILREEKMQQRGNTFRILLISRKMRLVDLSRLLTTDEIDTP